MTDQSVPAADSAETSTIATRSARRQRPRPMRYNAASAEALQQAAAIDSDTADESASKSKVTLPASRSDDAGGDLGLSAEDWAAAGEVMAQEAAQLDDGATDGDDTGDENTGEPANFADAFSPVAKDEPEPDRDGRYRTRLRDSEAEAERLRGTIEAMQRAEVTRLASARLADASDLFRDGAALADLCGDDGTVDPARVDSAVDGVLEQHPHWRAPLTPYRGPLRSGATSVEFERPTKTFADAFAPPRDE